MLTPQQPQRLPNATVVLILGICSLVFSCSFVGLILGIIGIVLSRKDKALFMANPQAYSGFDALNAGFIMSIIGIVLSAVLVVIALLVGSIAVGLFEILDNFYH